MKIALILDRFDPLHGGLEHWAWQWSTWLLDRGHEVAVVASEARRDLDREGLSLHSLGFADSRMAFAERVAAFLERFPADLVHDLGVGWRYDLLQPQFGTRLADDRRNLRSLPLLRRVPAMLSRRRRERLADIRALERRQYVDNPGHVVAVSAMTRDNLVCEHGLADGRITIIHNGVDNERFHPPHKEDRSALRKAAGLEDRIVLLFAAHNFRLKGLDTVLRALARLPAPQLHLLVVGRGTIERYSHLADRLGVSGRVTFAGFVPDIREAFAVADAFVQPTFYDPCSLSVLEAAASGLPVLTSRFNGASELFRDDVSALIVEDPEDATETAGRLQTLLDPDYRLRVASASLAVARQATAANCFSKLFDLCDQLQRRRRAA
jgi:UDP-glucose:(heptosyl)LPS alpha-1,3-glucosyltransferase